MKAFSFKERLQRKLERTYCRIGNNRGCNICCNQFGKFTKWNGGSINIPSNLINLEIVSSDPDNFGCPYCGSTDRERHLFLYFDALNLWSHFPQADVLHFAPEPNLRFKIAAYYPNRYLLADLEPYKESIIKMDATHIPFEDNVFDFVIANHILEHIPLYNIALSEIYRVIKPGGSAILQTPFSKVLRNNFEDPSINTDKLRIIYYGQSDHVRLFGEKELLTSIKNAGFKLNLINHNEVLSDHDSYYYGVNKKEFLIWVNKNGFQKEN